MRNGVIEPKRLLVMIMAVAVLLRVGTAVFFFGNEIQDLPGTFDEVSYHHLAIRVLDGHGFSFGEPWWPGTGANEPTAHWSYLYTGYLIALYGLFGANPLLARVLQGVIAGILMPLLAYRLAARIFGGGEEDLFSLRGGWRQAQKIGIVTAGISAVYVYFFYYAAALITESFYILSIMWSFDLAIQIVQAGEERTGRWLWLGVALGVTVLLRQLFLLFAPFMLLWMWWAKRPFFPKLAIPLAVTALLMLPWTVRNYAAFDTFVPLNTNSGHAFFWGNHPRYGAQFVPILPTQAYYAMIPQELRAQNLNEAEMDSALLKLGVENVLADPGRYVRLSLSRIPHYFMFWPAADSGVVSNVSRVASFGLFLPFMLYGLWLALRRPFSSWRERLASPLTLIYLFMLIYTAMHVLTWTLIRYRVPVDALLILFAGAALVTLAQRLGLGQKRPLRWAARQNM